MTEGGFPRLGAIRGEVSRIKEVPAWLSRAGGLGNVANDQQTLIFWLIEDEHSFGLEP